MRSSFSTAMAVVGTVVGAGFASGREVYHFFVRFGANGLVGALLSSLLMAALGARVIYLCKKYRTYEFNALVAARLGGLYGNLLPLCFSGSMWLGLSVMLSGAAAAGASLGVPQGVAIAFTGLVVISGISQGINGLKKVNVILTPFILLLILYLTFLSPGKTSGAFLILDPEEVSWAGMVGSAVLYAAFNSMLLAVVLPPLLSKEGKITGILLGFILVGTLLAMVTFLLLSFSQAVRGSPIPLLHVVGILTPRFPQFYAMLLWAALSTTALANAYGISHQLRSMTNLSSLSSGIIVTLSTLPLALQPFDQLVSTLYPILGYVALVVVGVVVWPKTIT